ncbi:MAG: HEAT repeat domain-containing protein [Treponema sp.]|uniref:HEAT repeat domain-containing protein n=1 Tax=Treponema sp. TaxID=166 RepID=UPI001B5BE79A|nr:HEAT repeat domain-containing protein [Treponema sp.]MBP5403139.1 HEAT repeat domain-containing protein [Treponema sp.]MBR5934358.1 HEAT repeat domain-containing protein [Treponema sp.]
MKKIFSVLVFLSLSLCFAQDKKAPLKPDPERVEKAALKDEGKNAVEEKIDTIRYGIESEIVNLIKSLIDNDDPRFSDELYGLFYQTKSVAVREKIIEYFTKEKDPCIEDYAVEILSDPYDTKNSTVDLLFKYISTVKTKEAVPHVLKLLESEDETYFSNALSALGEIGGNEEASYLIEYLDRDDLSVPQRQSLMKVLGKLKAEETYDRLAEIAQDEEENSFVRMYAAQAIGEMKKTEALPILVKLFETSDPNFRVCVIKGVSNYSSKEAVDVIIQGIKDGHWKVRQEALECAQKMNLEEAVPYIIYRAKKDPEKVIKEKAYEVLSKLNTSESVKFLIEQITDKKVDDGAKGRACEALLKNTTAGRTEIAQLAEEVAANDSRKQLRYTVGKHMSKYPDPKFGKASYEYMCSKDAMTCAIGIDMYASGRYSESKAKISEIAENPKAGANQKKARKVLQLD